MGDICKTTDSEYIKLEQSHDLEFHHDQQYFNFEEHKSYLLNDFEDAQNYSSSKQFQDAIATFNELPPYPEDCIYSDLEESFPSIEENALMSVNKVPTPSHELSYDSARMTPPCSPNKDLLLMAVLDHLSSFYADGEQGQQLFRVLINSLSKTSVLPVDSILTSRDEFADFRSQYKQQFSDIIHAALRMIGTNGIKLNKNPEEFLIGNRLPEFPLMFDMISLNTSRYKREFLELRLLGQGAYGSVYEARHNLDDYSYAVKKVVLYGQRTDVWFKILREVKFLAPLSHKHVVRYHAAWLEYLPYDIMQQGSINTANETPQSLFSKHNLVRRAIGRPHRPDVSLTGGISIVFESSSNGSSETRSYFKSNSLSHNLSDGGMADGFFDMRLATPCLNIENFIRKSCVVLHIQMELCSLTLKEWIHNRNKTAAATDLYACVSLEDNSVILRQILKALDYIHNCGLIHRDIKPQNIFFSKSIEFNLHVKVGDFGLTRKFTQLPMTPGPGLSTMPGNMEQVMNKDSDFTTSVGTAIYASPEQLFTSDYNYKSDMYSFGILMFELYQPFLTEMERSISLNHLRKGTMSDDFVEKWPTQSHLISSLLQKNAGMRPSAASMLHSQLFLKKDQVINNLEALLKKKDNTIKELQAQLEVYKRENELLTHKLSI